VRSIVKLIAVVFLILITLGCSIYHMQTPQILPPGKWSGGAAVSSFGNRESEGVSYFPGFWFRRGISPRFDIGFHSFLLGVKVDCKYNLVKDYLSVGAGLGAGGFPIVGEGAFIIGGTSAEASVYACYPGEIVTPYFAGRLTGASVSILGWEPVLAATSVGGLRVRISSRFSIYGEGGAMILFEEGDRTLNITGGLGIGYEFKR